MHCPYNHLISVIKTRARDTWIALQITVEIARVLAQMFIQWMTIYLTITITNADTWFTQQHENENFLWLFCGWTNLISENFNSILLLFIHLKGYMQARYKQKNSIPAISRVTIKFYSESEDHVLIGLWELSWVIC